MYLYFTATFNETLKVQWRWIPTNDLDGLLGTYNGAVREVKVSLRLSLGYNQSMPPETKELIAKKHN